MTDQAELTAAFQQLAKEQETLAEALIEREHDVEQHNLVIKTLQAQPGDKKSWRLVGDVLVERTVSEVLPEVEKNRDNLVAMVKTYQRQLESKNKEVLSFQEKYKMGTQVQAVEKSTEKRAQSSGVLVTN